MGAPMAASSLMICLIHKHFFYPYLRMMVLRCAGLKTRMGDGKSRTPMDAGMAHLAILMELRPSIFQGDVAARTNPHTSPASVAIAAYLEILAGGLEKIDAIGMKKQPKQVCNRGTGFRFVFLELLNGGGDFI